MLHKECETQLKKENKVSIRVYDSFGREIVKHTNKMKSVGEQNEELSLKNKPQSGIYYVNVFVGNKSFTKKVSIN